MAKKASCWKVALACVLLSAFGLFMPARAQERPNIILIYADDLGYGDVSAYGASRIRTPNVDRLASEGLKFTRVHAPSSTCTPSRYGLLTGEYAWRRKGTGIAPGNAALIIEPGRTTLPSVLKAAGYTTGVVGKWHLGLGSGEGPDWNGDIKPGPLEIGFDYAFLIPATGDRVPTVFVENHRVVGLDPADPIAVSYTEKIGDEPTGRENPELLKLHPSHGHDQTIVNGISRIGYMTGGRAARWVDEEIADVITGKAVEFIEKHREAPFFLFFSTHDVHVPRAPHERYAGKSGMGPRGDVILQLDGSVGQILETLDRLGLAEKTLVIFSSDNGPVLDDGYQDQAVELVGSHRPGGPLRGGKYSAFEAGTRVPFIVRWPGRVKQGVSDALISQVDLIASFAALSGIPLPDDAAPDSYDVLPALLGESSEGRDHLVEHSLRGVLSLVKGRWKYIEPGEGPAIAVLTKIETGSIPEPQLYDLLNDPGEQNNLAGEHPEIVGELKVMLERVRNGELARSKRSKAPDD